MSKKAEDVFAKQSNFIVFLVLAFFPLMGMGIDLIAPSLPSITQHLSVSPTFSKNLISIYLLGSALGNLCMGTLSDAVGRRKIMLYGLGCFTLSSIAPIFFPITFVLLATRFFQGFFLASFAIAARTIFSDLLSKERLLRVATLIATLWGLGPIVGPVIGGYLQFYFNWQAGFYFFSCYGLVGFISMYCWLPETHFNPLPFKADQLKKNFSEVLSHRQFMGLIILMGISYSLLIVFQTLGPFLFQRTFGKSPIYFGHLALLMGLSFLTATFVCRELIKKYTPEKIISAACCVFFVTSFVFMCIAIFARHNSWSAIIPSLTMFFACGIFYPAAMGKGLSLFRHLAGSAGAMMNLITLSITGLTAFILSLVTASNTLLMVCTYFILIILSGVCYWLLVASKK